MPTRKKLVISDQQIKGKLAECNFFLEHMEQSRDPQELGYYLSAFLSALATFTSLGLMRQHAKGVGRALEQPRKNSSDLDLLLQARNVEVHREGVRLWLYRAPVGKRRVPASPLQGRFPSSRFQSRFPRFGGGLWSSLVVTTRERRPEGVPKYPSRFGDDLRSALELTTRADSPKDDPGYRFIFEDSGRDVLKSCRSALDTVRPLGD